MKNVSLKDFINDERYFHLKDFNIHVSKVNLVKEKMEINISLKSAKFINIEIQKDREALFQEKVEDFTIMVDIDYAIDVEKNKKNKEYIEEIKEMIFNNIASSSSWIKNLRFKIEEDSFLLIFPNEMSLFSMKRSGYIKELKNLI